MENPVPSNGYDDEIDLFQLVETVWDGKWLIALFTAGAMALGGGFLALAPTTYTGDVQLQPQSQAYMSQFSSLYNISSIGDVTAGRSNADSQDLVQQRGVALQLTAEDLRTTFIREFEDYAEVRAQTSSVFADELSGVEPSKRALAALAMAKDFKIARPGKNQENYRLTFEAPSEAGGLEVLARALPEVYAGAASQIRQNIENFKVATLAGAVNELAAVEAALQAKVRAYEYETTSRVAFLREQAEIARELGIAQGTSVRVLTPDSSDSSVAVRAEEPLYERGYRALEKEISLIQNRSPEAFGHYIPGYRELVEQRELLLSDTRVAQIERALGQLPLGEGFTPVVIDLELMDVKSNRKTSLVLALSLVLGGMVGVLFVLIRSGYRGYKARQA
ncbi:Wzz/FepE/Etk N-terminal domain-containing protein [Litorivicinus lipolyticus]|uniref:Wzz/FepE/Etk N-terminal domain-containing protein n=1 Tax=Litorivicinus lipolyticus TaxID=418701 RepID=UPI003B5CF02E